MKCCINGGNYISSLFLLAKLFKFEIQKYGQILCAHKPYFLMPGNIFKLRTYCATYVYIECILNLAMHNKSFNQTRVTNFSIRVSSLHTYRQSHDD